MATEKVKLGLIGLGSWGKNILRNLNGLGVLYRACDTDPSILSERGTHYTDIDFTPTPDEIINCHEIEAVAIATPASTHYRLVKESLLAGKDVFVEKPLAMTVREGEELVAIAEREGRIVMVGHILHYHRAVIKLKEIISKGSYVCLYKATCQFAAERMLLVEGRPLNVSWRMAYKHQVSIYVQ